MGTQTIGPSSGRTGGQRGYWPPRRWSTNPVPRQSPFLQKKRPGGDPRPRSRLEPGRFPNLAGGQPVRRLSRAEPHVQLLKQLVDFEDEQGPYLDLQDGDSPPSYRRHYIIPHPVVKGFHRKRRMRPTTMPTILKDKGSTISIGSMSRFSGSSLILSPFFSKRFTVASSSSRRATTTSPLRASS